jgi:hypothetical protein
MDNLIIDLDEYKKLISSTSKSIDNKKSKRESQPSLTYRLSFQLKINLPLSSSDPNSLKSIKDWPLLFWNRWNRKCLATSLQIRYFLIYSTRKTKSLKNWSKRDGYKSVQNPLNKSQTLTNKLIRLKKRKNNLHKQSPKNNLNNKNLLIKRTKYRNKP